MVVLVCHGHDPATSPLQPLQSSWPGGAPGQGGSTVDLPALPVQQAVAPAVHLPLYSWVRGAQYCWQLSLPPPGQGVRQYS